MPTPSDRPDPIPHSVEELLRVLEARDAEVRLLRLTVQKLKLQLARRNRTLFGSSSERFEDGQDSLIEPALPDEIAAPAGRDLNYVALTGLLSLSAHRGQRPIVPPIVVGRVRRLRSRRRS